MICEENLLFLRYCITEEPKNALLDRDEGEEDEEEEGEWTFIVRVGTDAAAADMAIITRSFFFPVNYGR
mgnify:CR=1 FL=1